MATERATRPTFEQATAQYVHRFTLDHMPTWALRPAANGQYYAPQFASDREWYNHTYFRGDPLWIGQGSDCYTSGQTWPLGRWLTAPYLKGRVR